MPPACHTTSLYATIIVIHRYKDWLLILFRNPDRTEIFYDFWSGP